MALIATDKYREEAYRAMMMRGQQKMQNMLGLQSIGSAQSFGYGGMGSNYYSSNPAPPPPKKREENRPRSAMELLQSEVDTWLAGVKI